jgi:putative acetyltransferase
MSRDSGAPVLALRDAVSADSAPVRELVCEVLAEYGLKPNPGGSDGDLADVVASYSARGGVFRVLVSEAGEIVGCGGLYPLDDRTAEIRKMYFRPAARGRGFGRELLTDLVDGARERGFRRVVLETASVLERAIALYRSFGFNRYQPAHLAERCDQAFALELGKEGE